MRFLKDILHHHKKRAVFITFIIKNLNLYQNYGIFAFFGLYIIVIGYNKEKYKRSDFKGD